ncbi:MAG: export protein FliQ, family 3 [Proteobacteria bacterium]|nr:export protein FliQ, family 3 [Pseudomonadota bacterium]
MTPELVVDVIRQALITAFWLSAPLLATGFCVGIAISLLQILTSIQDTGFNTIPRLLAFLGVLLVSMPWMLRQLVTYTGAMFGDLSRYAR